MSAQPLSLTGADRTAGSHLTFKGNRKDTRYGWLRLTPAYSLNLVDELLEDVRDDGTVLDPFCGTGTTALLCGQRSIRAVTTDINPFLIWLTRTKTASYTGADLAEYDRRANAVAEAITQDRASTEWLPAIHQIEKWWDAFTLHGLGRAMATIKRTDAGTKSDDLLRIAFCRTAIESASVSFRHQSMSFKATAQEGVLQDDHLTWLVERWQAACASIGNAAETTAVPLQGEALLTDARELTLSIAPESIARVITSPPYPNRMSYIRELRPYLYWLGYLTDAREAGELDWNAIGGTWGTATSRVGKWEPDQHLPIPYEPFDQILHDIATGNGRNGPLLSRYVHKYFYDMVQHVDQLYTVMEPGATAYYIVGNSKFYDTLLPVQDIYAGLFAKRGYKNIEARAFRKRSSKKELYEYLVTAQRP